MPTFDDELPDFSMPSRFKISKRASKIKKIESTYQRQAAIRSRLPIDENHRIQFDVMALYENLDAGKFPTNEQLCRGLHILSDMMSNKRATSLSLKKVLQVTIDNVVQLLNAIQDFIKTKNEASSLQHFLYYLRLSSKSPEAESRLKELMSDLSFLENAKQLLILLVTNSDFRDIMVELSQAIGGIFSKQHSGQTSKESVQQDEQLAVNREAVVRFLNLIDEIAQNKEHQKAVEYIISCVRKSEREIKEMLKSDSIPKDADNYSETHVNLTKARKELQTLLEKVANHSLNDIQNRLLVITNLLKKDYKLRNILDDLVTFFERSLRDEDFRNDPDTILAGSDLIDQTRSYVDSSCGENIHNLFKDFNEFLKAIQDDSHVQRLSAASKALLDNFYYKIDEKMVLKYDLVNDLVMLLLPNLLNQFRMITIPSITGSTPKYDFILENLELSVDDLLPSFIEANIKKGIMMGIRDQITDQKYSSISLVLHELHIDILSVPFSFKLKSISLQDRGTFDLQTLKTGISINLKLDYHAEDMKKTLEIANSDIFMDKIKLKIKGKHGALYWLFNPAIKNMIRSKFATVFKAKIQEYVAKADMIVTARKLQYKRSNASVSKEKRSCLTPPLKISTPQESFAWETNVFDLSDT